MARLSNVSVETPDTRAVNLTILLARLHNNLITPDIQTERNLRTSQRERDRASKNLEYARDLLVKLEQDTQFHKVQSKKQQAQLDLVHKRDQIILLMEKLDELNELKENDVEDDSEGEDLLGEDTPSEDTQSQASHPEPIRTPSSLREDTPPSAPVYDTPTVIPESPPPVPVPEPDPTPVTAPQPDPASTLRARHKAERSELLTSATTTTSISTSTTEVLLTHHRTEQEDLTKSLLDMARALKESSHAFNSTLEQEKNVLDSAAKGLDKNELGLEAATRKMGYLRTMTEGKGWLGRMMMYAWIAGLMVVAILVVFVLPKLRL